MKTKKQEMNKALRKLRAAGIEFEQPGPWHIQIHMGKQLVNFWPTAQKCSMNPIEKAKFTTTDKLIDIVRRFQK